MTWIRKMSANLGRQSGLNARKIKFSPFWLNRRIPDSMIDDGESYDELIHARWGALEEGEVRVAWSMD